MRGGSFLLRRARPIPHRTSTDRLQLPGLDPGGDEVAEAGADPGFVPERCRAQFDVDDTRRGYDWTGRYPAISVTATLLRAKSFTLDGEAVVCGPDGVAIFDALHRRGTVSEAMLYAFDLLELDGEDLRAPR